MKKLLFRILIVAVLSVLLLTATFADENTAPILYTDSYSGVSFSVPAGWELKEICDEDVYNITFSSPAISGSSIVYWCGDLCEEDESSRSEINNDSITKEDAAEIYEITADQIEIVYYNGSSYFCMEEEYEITVHGIDGTYTVTQLAHFRDGWMHQFEFLGTDESEGFSDFESLMNTVEYPLTEQENALWIGAVPSYPDPFEEAAAPYAPKDPFGEILENVVTDTGSETVLTAEEDRNGTRTGLIVLFGLAAAVFCIGFTFAKKNRKQRKSVESDLLSINTLTICTGCGARIPAGSKTCHLCGCKVKKR